MATEPPIYDLVLLLDTQADDERRTEILDNVQAAIEKGGDVVCSSSTATTRCSSSSTTH